MSSIYSLLDILVKLKDDFLWSVDYYYTEVRYYLFRKPKYFIQRGIRGYSDEDLRNLGDYYKELISNSLLDFTKLKSSHPMKYKDIESWVKEIKESADSIQYWLTQDNLLYWQDVEVDIYDYASVKKIQDGGLNWVVQHIDNLWN